MIVHHHPEGASWSALFLFETRIQCKRASWACWQPGLGTRGTGKPVVSGVMGLDCREAGHRKTLLTRCKKVLASTAVAAVHDGRPVVRSGDSPAFRAARPVPSPSIRCTPSESLTVTYMKNGKYIPSAMKKINYILRDWRRNEVITIDPKTIDLMWELHADLGSQASHPHRQRLSLAQDQCLPEEDRPQRGPQEPAHGRQGHRHLFPRHPTREDPQQRPGSPGRRRRLLSHRRRPHRFRPCRFRPCPPLGPCHQPIRRWRRSCATTRRRSARAAARPT